ncbi:hypothetical protein F4678DRAFT_93012 [Xylaria arbuscula]|nr:hypothetical protein F4678DRAFT_93012 [Xylaria arbuscula]
MLLFMGCHFVITGTGSGQLTRNKCIRSGMGYIRFLVNIEFCPYSKNRGNVSVNIIPRSSLKIPASLPVLPAHQN